jgi:heme exporter protein A
MSTELLETAEAQGVDYAIEIEGLTKAFGSFYALRGVDLKVPKGEFLTLLGPNGAGKTTLIKILATLSQPTAGFVSVAGVDMKTRSVDVRSVLGVISHQIYLYDDLTAEENLRFYGKMFGVANLESRIEGLLRRVGLYKRRYDPVRNYSRGMQQRLSIARALIHDPEILLLDEPDTGLDQHSADMLGEMLRDLNVPGRSIIMTTHHLERGIEMCDRVAILSGGRIVFDRRRELLDVGDFRRTYYEFTGARG